MAVLFKLPPIEIAMLSLIPFAWQYFTHANIKFGFGPLWWLLTSPNYHRPLRGSLSFFVSIIAHKSALCP